MSLSLDDILHDFKPPWGYAKDGGSRHYYLGPLDLSTILGNIVVCARGGNARIENGLEKSWGVLQNYPGLLPFYTNFDQGCGSHISIDGNSSCQGFQSLLELVDPTNSIQALVVLKEASCSYLFADLVNKLLGAADNDEDQMMALRELSSFASWDSHVTNFFVVSSRSGTTEKLTHLLDKALSFGLHVVMDILPSHASFTCNPPHPTNAYMTFGPFLLCSDASSTCENPVFVLKILIHACPSLALLTNYLGDTLIQLALASFKNLGFCRLDKHTKLMKELLSEKIVNMRNIINVGNNDGRTIHVAVIHDIHVSHFVTGFTETISYTRLQQFFQTLELADRDWVIHESKNVISVDAWKALTENIGCKEPGGLMAWYWDVIKKMSKRKGTPHFRQWAPGDVLLFTQKPWRSWRSIGRIPLCLLELFPVSTLRTRLSRTSGVMILIMDTGSI